MSYDTANRPNSVSGVASGTGQTVNYASSVSYAAHGGLAGFAMGNSVVPAYAYNSRLQPSNSSATIASSTSKYLFATIPNWGATTNNGTLLGVTVQAGGPGTLSSLPSFTTTFSYDAVNRVNAVNDGNYARAFSYDPYGNMWVTPNTAWGIAPAGPTSNVYNSKNQASGLGYDGSGRVTANGSTSFSYDAEDRQTQAADAPGIGGGTVTYSFDAIGERVQKQIAGGGALTAYVYDAFGQLTAEYSTALTIPLCTTCYLTSDHLGSTRMVTDQNGNVVARHDFLPFGEEIQASQAGRGSLFGSTTDVEQKFTGQIRDTETGNDYFNARYYMSSYGRFMSPDPGNAGADVTNPQSWNAYAYVLGNPLANIDRSGMDCVTFDNGSTGDDGQGTACPGSQTSQTAGVDGGGLGLVGVWNYSAITGRWGPTPNDSSNGGSGGGNPGPTSTPPPKTGNCPGVPAHPANQPPQALYNLGVDASKSVYDNLSPDLAKTLAYAALVAPNQPLDFKNQPFHGANPQYRAYGNFAFGVFGNALGFSSTYIKWGAGVASYANMLANFKLPPSSWGTPFTGAPYGDNPLEQKEIQSGYQWAQMYAAGKCP